MVASMFPVHLDGVHVRRRGKTLLGPVTLSLQGQGLTVVLGPNGAGKTTFLKSLFGMERLSDGEIRWQRPLAEVDLRRAYVFQQPIMLRRSVGENLAYPLRLRKRRDVGVTVRHWAAQVGLADHLDAPALRLSGGEKQKLALARALITAPDLLVLDEPCASLDGRATREIEEILQRVLAAGTRIVMATHDLGQARRLATDALFLFKGNVQAQLPAPEFFAHPPTPQIQAFLKGDIVE